jgi:hypothetical protein
MPDKRTDKETRKPQGRSFTVIIMDPWDIVVQIVGTWQLTRTLPAQCVNHARPRKSLVAMFDVQGI